VGAEGGVGFFLSTSVPTLPAAISRRAMTVAFLIPTFGMLWGALFLGERITAGMLLGCFTILLGTALVAGLLRPPGKTPTPPAEG
jgi:drug/metabolite transporter (DMT)-like permease